MTNVIKESFGINLSVLKTFLLYTPKKATHSYKVRAYITFVLFMFHVPILGLLYFIFEKNIEMKRVSDNAFVLAEMCCYVPKLLPFVSKADQIMECIHYFESPSFVELRENQKVIIETSVKTCRRNSRIFIVCLTGGFLLWASKPFFVSGYKLPIDIWFPINPVNNFIIYYSIYFWLFLGAGYPAVASAAVEPLIAGLACLASAHLNVLKDNLQNMYEYVDEEHRKYSHEVFENRNKDDIIFTKIELCIKHHKAVLHFAKIYEDCFSQVVFSQFVGSIFVLGFCCLQLSMIEPFSIEFLSTSSYFAILLTQIYFYCYYGTSLFEESAAVRNAVYMGKWYEYDIKCRKALIILMERSKRPMKITAGKILDLSLETFTTILRRSYSLLAVLNNQK